MACAAATYIKANLTNLKVGLFLEMATTLGALTGLSWGVSWIGYSGPRAVALLV